MHYLLVLLLPASALATPTIEELKASPCAPPASKPAAAESCRRTNSHMRKEILDCAQKEKARVKRELAMFKLINERHDYESIAPECLSINECNSLIKDAENGMTEAKATLHHYGPGLQQSLNRIKPGAKFQAGTQLDKETIEFIGDASRYYKETPEVDAWIGAGAPDPAAHRKELDAAYGVLKRFSERKFEFKQENALIERNTKNVTEMRAQIQRLAKRPKSDAEALKIEEARWSAYLERAYKKRNQAEKYSAHQFPAPGEPGFETCGLSVAERAALWWYSEKGSGIINPELWAGKDKDWQPYLETMNEALKKLPPVDESYRGATIPDNVLPTYEPTAPAFKSLGFMSTSADAKNHFSGKHQFDVHSTSGRWIAPFSAHAKELEVLVPHGVMFKTLKKDGGAYVIQEVPGGTQAP